MFPTLFVKPSSSKNPKKSTNNYPRYHHDNEDKSRSSVHAPSPLQLAVSLQHFEQVESLLQNSANANVKLQNGSTLAHLAVETGSADVVSFVIKSVDVNKCDKLKRTPLHLAVKAGNEQIVDLLLNSKADIDAQDNCGNTALHKAVKHGHGSLVAHLLRKGANPNLTNESGNTPLHDSFHQCAAAGDALIGKLVKFGGNDLELKDGKGRNALHLAVTYGSYETIQQLLKMVKDVNQLTNKRETALHLALKCTKNDHNDVPYLRFNGQQLFSLIESLVQQGADVNALDQDEKTPLDYAVRSKKCYIIEYLVLADARLNCNGKYMSVAQVIKQRDDKSMKCFIECLNDCDCADKTKILSLLGMPIEDKETRYETIKFLLESGVNANELDASGSALLHQCIAKEDVQLFKLFLEFAANVQATNAKGETPLFHLMQAECQISDERCSMIHALLDAGANVDERLNGVTPLHRSIETRNLKLFGLLIERDADVHMKREEYNNLLNMAIAHNLSDAARILTERRSADFNTPAHTCSSTPKV